MGVKTERLYYTDSYLTRFDANVVDLSPDGLRATLDRSAFYPASGGQPHDTGTIGSARVVDVIDEEDLVVHVLERPIATGTVQGEIDWQRRFDYMQQHTGQHLLSGVFHSMFGYETVAVHFGDEIATVELETASVSADQLTAVELRANEIVCENRPVIVGFEDAASAAGLRKETGREGEIRIVAIEGLDRSACGGTHVRRTGEIGPILLRKTEKIRGNTRVEFVCGLRAVRRARRDFDLLTQTARVFSAALDETPALVASMSEQAKEAGKARRKMAVELAERRGRELWNETPANETGRRLHSDSRGAGALDDEVRALAMSFTAQPGAVFVVSSEDPPSVLLSVSEDSGIHAGNALKPILTGLGGRGGGNARLAQGSLPNAEAVREAVSQILHL